LVIAFILLEKIAQISFPDVQFLISHSCIINCCISWQAGIILWLYTADLLTVYQKNAFLVAFFSKKNERENIDEYVCSGNQTVRAWPYKIRHFHVSKRSFFLHLEQLKKFTVYLPHFCLKLNFFRLYSVVFFHRPILPEGIIFTMDLRRLLSLQQSGLEWFYYSLQMWFFFLLSFPILFFSSARNGTYTQLYNWNVKFLRATTATTS